MNKKNAGVDAPTEPSGSTNVDCPIFKCFVCDQLSVFDDMVIVIFKSIDGVI